MTQIYNFYLELSSFYCIFATDMKKICFLVDSIFSIGGIQRVTAVLAKSLAKDYDVTIVTRESPSKENTSLYQLNESNIHFIFFHYPKTNLIKSVFCKIYSALYKNVLPKTRVTSDWYAHSSFPSEKRKALATVLMKGSYDAIIGVHAPLAIRLAACKPLLGNSKVIGWIHNTYQALFEGDFYFIGSELRKHYEYQLEKLDKTIVLSRYDTHKYPFPTEVIYNPQPLIIDQIANGTSKTFLSVGRFSFYHKGTDILIKAFRIFAEHNKEWSLEIVGEGGDEPYYHDMIQEYGLQDRISICPSTNHIQDYYSHAQVYVLSSRWEGFGLVLLEAMAHGLPVISSDIPTSKEIMGDFSLYFKNESIKQLAQRLEDATHIDWQQKSKEAIEIAKRFDIDRITQQWKQLIED